MEQANAVYGWLDKPSQACSRGCVSGTVGTGRAGRATRSGGPEGCGSHGYRISYSVDGYKLVIQVQYCFETLVSKNVMVRDRILI